jgi:hypothetical protein
MHCCAHLVLCCWRLQHVERELAQPLHRCCGVVEAQRQLAVGVGKQPLQLLRVRGLQLLPRGQRGSSMVQVDEVTRLRELLLLLLSNVGAAAEAHCSSKAGAQRELRLLHCCCLCWRQPVGQDRGGGVTRTS